MRLDSRTSVYCHEFLHKKYAPNSFPELQPDEPNEVVEEFKKQGFAHELKVVKALTETIQGLVAIDQSMHSSEIQSETAKALLNPETFMIIGGYISEITEKELADALGKKLNPSNRASRPDVMIRVGVRTDGTPAWAPVDIKSHKAITTNQTNTVFLSNLEKILPEASSGQRGRLSLEDLHQLAHYTRHFQALGIESEDLWVGIIGREVGECVWARLGDVVEGTGKNATSFLSSHDQDFARAVEVIELSTRENVDSKMKSGVIPVLSTGKMGCTACMYKSTCLSEMKSFDNGNGHVTLLAGVTPGTALKNFPEIQSIQELLDFSPKNDSMATAQIRARVWKSGVPEILNPTEEIVIPEADIEIDIDLENSMEALRVLEIGEPMGVDRLYLYGFGIHDRTINKDWRTANIETYSDYSNTEEGEYLVLSQMWNRLQSEIVKAESTGKSIKIFHYANHEFLWFQKYSRRYSGRPGVPSEDELETFKIDYLVDLLPVTRKFSFPSMTYSIKDLAPLAGFEWEVDKAGGANSLLKFRSASDPKADAKVREEAIAWLDSYNRDDVRATFAVRAYIRGILHP